MAHENLPCCKLAEGSLFTWFETTDRGAFLLPYSGLLAAHLPPADGGLERLELLYVTHTVVINGTNLSVLVDNIQRGRANKIYIGEDKTREGAKYPAIRALNITSGQDASSH